jgi:hypothetical protein
MASMLGMGLLVSCSHYNWGATGALPFRNLYVAPVQSSANVAQAQAPVTSQLRQSLLQEGMVTLTNQADADATLQVILVDYHQDVAATDTNNTLNAQSYTLELTAKCTLVNNHTGQVYFKDRPVTASEEAFIQSGDSFTQSAYQAIPQLARDLGTKIKDSVISTW